MRAYSVVRRSFVFGALSALGGSVGVTFLGCGNEDPIVITPRDTTSSSSSTSSTSSSGVMVNCVIDGKVSDTEQCDDGNMISGDGCENDCTFTCSGADVNGNAQCNDGDACNGAETCNKDHVCVAGSPLAEGTECAAGKVCKGGICGDVTCGDGFTSPPSEECDDANLVSGDGCDSCLFSCLSNDPTRDCSGGDPCAGSAKCDDSVHTCMAGVPLADGTACGAANAYCVGGACTVSVCGNSVTEFGEACDDGNALDGDGCDIDCTLSCVNPGADCAAAPVCQKATCTAHNTCANVADAAQDNAACGMNLICKTGACISPPAVCGNGTLEAGEQCDFGAGNGPGTGCEATCVYSCTMAPDSCPDANACNGVEACTAVMVGGKAGQKCAAGVPLADCTACAGGVCGGGTCKVSACGDGCVDAATGEQCEPPGSMTCDATCKTVALAVCGNGVRDAGEQCDDSNTTNLDGCDSTCKFEQLQRATWVNMQFSTDAFCTANKLGGAIVSGTAQNSLQQGLDTGVQNGSTTIIFKSIGLDDLTGTADPTLQLGTLGAAPVIPMGGPMYDGTNDLDWWHAITAASIDANRNPLNTIPASIAAKVLTAGPGSMEVPLILANGMATPLHMSGVKLSVLINGTSTPTVSAGTTPGHVAAEHLDPALVSFTTCGQKTAAGGGKLCGNTAAYSLANVPIPTALAGGGFTSCAENYALTNSMLDVLIGGCTVLFMPQIAKTQPDTSDPSVPAAGAGAPYTLSANAAKVVSTCKDKNMAVVPLAACLNAAAYSTYFKFATGRVIGK